MQNALAHWYLATLLLPALSTAADEGGARAIFVSSVTAELAAPVNWDTFTDMPARAKFGRQNLYAQSKLFDIIIAKEFARRYGHTGIVFSALNPGEGHCTVQRMSALMQVLQATSSRTCSGTCPASNASSTCAMLPSRPSS